MSASVPCRTSDFSFMEGPTFRFPTGMMAWFLLESNRRYCAIFRRQVWRSCQETAERPRIEGGVVVITNERSAMIRRSVLPSTNQSNPCAKLSRKSARSRHACFCDPPKSVRLVSAQTTPVRPTIPYPLSPTPCSLLPVPPVPPPYTHPTPYGGLLLHQPCIVLSYFRGGLCV